MVDLSRVKVMQTFMIAAISSVSYINGEHSKFLITVLLFACSVPALKPVLN